MILVSWADLGSVPVRGHILPFTFYSILRLAFRVFLEYFKLSLILPMQLSYIEVCGLRSADF